MLPTARSRSPSTGWIVSSGSGEDERFGTLGPLHEQDRTPPSNVPACWRVALRTAELPGQQAPLPTRPARPWPEADLRVPDSASRKAEAPSDLPGLREADA